MVTNAMFRNMIISFGLVVICVASTGSVMAKSLQPGFADANKIYVPEVNKYFGAKNIRVSYSLSTYETFARQFLTIQYQLETNDSFITLGIDYQKTPGEEMIPLTVKKQTTGQSEFKYRYQFNVKYYTTRTGEKILSIPPLIYSEGGKIKYYFSFKPQRIVNTPLPPYLPPYIPVGGIELESDFPESESWSGWYEKDKIYYWNIHLQAENVTPDVLPEIRQQLRSNKGIKFLPAETSHKTVKGIDNIVQKIHYSIPFVLTASGKVKLPELRLQSFNAQTRRLNNQQFSFGYVVAFHSYVQWFIEGVILLLLLIFLRKIWPLVKRVRYHLGILIRARKQIKMASTIVQLRAAMQLMAKAFFWPENQSVEKCMECWFRDIEKTNNADAFINPINRGLYSSLQLQSDSFYDVKRFLYKSVFRQYMKCLILAWKHEEDSDHVVLGTFTDNISHN